MKPLIPLARFAELTCFSTFLLLSLPASARNVPLAKGGFLSIPDQAVVSPEGVTFVRSGEPAPFTLPWQSVDLKRLAQQNPDLETSRQKALLTGEKTLLGPEAPKANPYAEFLNLPVKVIFRPKETRQSRTDFNSVTNATPLIDPNTGFPIAQAGTTLDRNGNRVISVAPVTITNGVVTTGQPLLPAIPGQTVTSSSATHSDTTIDLTRPPLDTTVSGFLELISDDSKASTGSLIRELREHPDVFTALIGNLRELQSQVPADPAPSKALQAVQAISKPGSLSVDAQRQLGQFVRHAQARSATR